MLEMVGNSVESAITIKGNVTLLVTVLNVSKSSQRDGKQSKDTSSACCAEKKVCRIILIKKHHTLLRMKTNVDGLSTWVQLKT